LTTTATTPAKTTLATSPMPRWWTILSSPAARAIIAMMATAQVTTVARMPCVAPTSTQAATSSGSPV
jgi:hypothetical protein